MGKSFSVIAAFGRYRELGSVLKRTCGAQKAQDLHAKSQNFSF